MLPNNLVEVRKNHKFNLSSLNKWIDNHLENFENIIDVKQFVGGQSNPTFVLFFENKEKLILRNPIILTGKCSSEQHFFRKNQL